MPLYDLTTTPELTAPALIVALEGWVDAGSAATEAVAHIADNGTTIATFDADSLYDFRANRPVVEFVEGVMETVTWPHMTLVHVPSGARDLLVLTGTEPNWHWQELGNDIADLAVELGVVEHVTLGGVPWAVPHTAPVRLVTTASRADLIGQDEHLPDGLLRVPGAAVSIIERYVVQKGIPAVGFWARIPHYVGTTYVPGVLTLVERVSRHLGVNIPLGSLVDDAKEQREQLDAIVAAQPQAKAYVERLESMAEAEVTMPSGEDIAAEIERFLAEAGDTDPFGEGSDG